MFGEQSRATATCVAPRAWIRHLAPITWRVPHHINFPRSHGPILASREDGGRLGNYGDPGAAIAKRVRGEIGFAGLRLDGRLRHERPNRNAFTSLALARRIIEVCDYSLVRSHSSLGRLSFPKHVNRLESGAMGVRPNLSAVRKRGAGQECVRHRHPLGRQRRAREGSEMTTSFNKIDHLRCRVDCQRMMPWGPWIGRGNLSPLLRAAASRAALANGAKRNS
jgi:hypothetical protein